MCGEGAHLTVKDTGHCRRSPVVGTSVIVVALALPGLAVKIKVSEELYRWRRERTTTERLAAMVDRMLTRLRFAKEVRLFGLGEPTSGLEALAEAELFSSFRRLIAGRTALVISHRFSSVRMADRIYVPRAGWSRAAATGSSCGATASMPGCST